MSRMLEGSTRRLLWPGLNLDRVGAPSVARWIGIHAEVLDPHGGFRVHEHEVITAP
jgi:hypothetical protein